MGERRPRQLRAVLLSQARGSGDERPPGSDLAAVGGGGRKLVEDLRGEERAMRARGEAQAPCEKPAALGVSAEAPVRPSEPREAEDLAKVFMLCGIPAQDLLL